MFPFKLQSTSDIPNPWLLLGRFTRSILSSIINICCMWNAVRTSKPRLNFSLFADWKWLWKPVRAGDRFPCWDPFLNSKIQGDRLLFMYVGTHLLNLETISSFQSISISWIPLSSRRACVIPVQSCLENWKTLEPFFMNFFHLPFLGRNFRIVDGFQPDASVCG